MRLALVESAKAVSSHGLHQADVDEGIIVLQEGCALQRDGFGQRVEIMIQQLLAQRGREISLGIVEQRSYVVLQSALASALIVDEIRLAVAQHDVSGLKVAVEEVVARRRQQELGQMTEVVLECLLVERNAGQSQEIIFKVIQIPRDRLAIKAGTRIAEFVVEIASRL